MEANHSTQFKPTFPFSKLPVELQLEVWRFAAEDWISTPVTNDCECQSIFYAEEKAPEIQQAAPFLLPIPNLPGLNWACHQSRIAIHTAIHTLLILKGVHPDTAKSEDMHGPLYTVKTYCGGSFWQMFPLKDFRVSKEL